MTQYRMCLRVISPEVRESRVYPPTLDSLEFPASPTPGLGSSGAKKALSTGSLVLAVRSQACGPQNGQ